MRGFHNSSFDPPTLVVLEAAFDEAWLTLKSIGNGRDVFVHISAVESAGLSSLNEGQQIETPRPPSSEARLITSTTRRKLVH